MKVCKKCGVEKPLEQFSALAIYCRPCVKARNAAWRAANPSYYAKRTVEFFRGAQLKYKYGLSVQEWNDMLIAQGGLCAICSDVLVQGKSTHVDHNHADGRVRSLLCWHCNRGLGGFKDSVAILNRAVKYLLATPGIV